jgi:hypothetical protein
MNERIRELAEQAGWGKGETYDDCMQCSPFDPEIFAELIVRECLGIVNRKEYSYHEADPLWETAQLIKEHFGVED